MCACVCETLVSLGRESGPWTSGCRPTAAVGWTVAPGRDVHILTPRLCEYELVWKWGLYRCSSGAWGDVLGYPGGPFRER